MKKERIVLIDILRGFALLLIVLIHSVEHFEFFKKPEIHFLFSDALDDKVMEYTMLFIRGKAYSIFALLFGLSFFIQMKNKELQGIDYRRGFLWRMTLLFVFGFLHSLIYRGDILHMYALLSLPILLLYKVRTPILLTIVFLLIIQIPFIYELYQSFYNSEYKYVKLLKEYWGEGNTTYSNGNILDVIKYNLWKGRESVWAWTIYNGRYLQLIALFIIGIIIGRKQVFEKATEYKKGFIITLFTSIVAFCILYFINITAQNLEVTKLQKWFVTTIFTSLMQLSGTFLYISCMVLIYLKFNKAYIFKLFSAYGKMSLSNYVFQAITGVVLFYGFGFSLHKYLGSTWSLILGFSIFFTQAFISIHWNKKYYYGPLEWLWRCATDLSFDIKFKK